LSSHPPATTTISTIAVQSGATRIVVALLQVTKFKSFCYPAGMLPSIQQQPRCIHVNSVQI
jgi:hypothetical protein